ncbi:keratin, type I cytoskeletal 18-like isoform X2 [Amblyraja radiata]|uniref:keratin, type I cytoskeletal 18-like isoform X2 n=1 Tax=Amblyraja radiata TaxID=386614 RepID=UPI001402053B|nr:keratin, type I cytoskeletal 18-like isoform X2 [Amblyraja radiata]
MSHQRSVTSYSTIGGSNRLSSKLPRYSSVSMQGYSSRPRASGSTMSYRGGSGLGLGLGLGLGSGVGLGSSHASSSFSIMPGGCVINNEKGTMQELNDRLARYLEKVRTLEQSNKELEIQIQALGSTNNYEGFDWSTYNCAVRPLQQQIINAMLQNSRIALETDNAKLAAEDFQCKLRTEQCLRMSVEADIDGLHNLKANYLHLHENLNQDIIGLEDEIAFLKKNHEEELRLLRQQKTQDIEVQVDSEPTENLDQILADLREKYSKQACDNKAAMDGWYQQQLQIKETTVFQNDQALDGVKNEMCQYRRQLQDLDMEYSSLIGSINALQNSLNQIEGNYDMQLRSLQTRIAQLEGELGSIRNELLHQNEGYESLLNIKMQLEAEIAQYRLLLSGGHCINTSGSSSSQVSQSYSKVPASSVITTKVITEKVMSRH